MAIKSKKPPRLAGSKSYKGMVPETGLEPVWSCLRGILSPLRLPFRHSGASETLAQMAASLNAKAQKKGPKANKWSPV